MKFLCIPCDTPMKLQEVGPPERGSLSVVYSCPECGYEMAMLTNAYETQVVQSLGVRIGPDRPGAEGAAAGQAGAAATGTGSAQAPSKMGCPFAEMIPSADRSPMEGARNTANAGATTVGGAPVPVRWTAEAEARLEKVPTFVRPMARAGIEKFAQERGALEVDEQILDAAREFFGM